jgi:meiosis-specific protein
MIDIIIDTKMPRKRRPASPDTTKLTKLLLLSTIGTVAFIRGFFPESNFKDSSSPMTTRSSRSTVTFKTLERGRSHQADNLLDYLVYILWKYHRLTSTQENGVFDAIDNRYLKSLTLAIYFDQHQPTCVQETYTFDFYYPPQAVATFAMMISAQKRIILHPAQVDRCFQRIIRQTIFLAQRLSPLPEKFFLTLKLQLDETCTPSEYPLCGFREALESDHLQFPPESDTLVVIL